MASNQCAQNVEIDWDASLGWRERLEIRRIVNTSGEAHFPGAYAQLPTQLLAASGDNEKLSFTWQRVIFCEKLLELRNTSATFFIIAA